MYGSPVSFAAGNGAASAAQDVTALHNRTVDVTATGPVYLRWGSVAVTDSAFDHFLAAGQPLRLRISSTLDEVTAWGDGGAWIVSLAPVA